MTNSSVNHLKHICMIFFLIIEHTFRHVNYLNHKNKLPTMISLGNFKLKIHLLHRVTFINQLKCFCSLFILFKLYNIKKTKSLCLFFILMKKCVYLKNFIFKKHILFFFLQTTFLGVKLLLNFLNKALFYTFI